MLRVSAIFMACLLLATAAPTAPEKSNACLSMCLQERPACASDEVCYSVTSLGCWGCCQKIEAVTAPVQRESCLSMCQQEKPNCASDEKPAGFEGCWGCCQKN
ncbi:multiple drug resistance protein [Aspergillus oryzae 3.042]|uniref:Multiple drug resistance protein n=1 Tax=Aspergillus oryzae (strain 3.042) TaxID=1160506 RepID=I8TIB7_ASPO3|nr:multiple drug resistance protein [Aspergillus oryzae 3.042]|eukprot:EIT73800.1 multiple drug resistance protein [Aspergillus oryzae 3.042]